MTIIEAKEKLLDVARGQIGYHEGANNYIKYAEGNWDNQFYGWELQNQPWCDVFADWCFCEAFGMQLGAAMTYQQVGSASALCRTSAEFYKNNRAFDLNPDEGDQIFFYYGGNINHIGIVESVTKSNGAWTSITTIEGNSSDMVARRTYRYGDGTIAGFGHPNWNLVASNGGLKIPYTPIKVTTPTYSDGILRRGSEGNDVRLIQNKLIKLRYDCGPTGADGKFGNKTYEAVRKFQSDKKIYPIDGEVGPLTIAALNKELNIEDFEVGEIVEFIGNTQYVNSMHTKGVNALPGKAKIKLVNKTPLAKHQYNIEHIDSTSNVCGWVDEDTLKKIKE